MIGCFWYTPLMRYILSGRLTTYVVQVSVHIPFFRLENSTDLESPSPILDPTPSVIVPLAALSICPEYGAEPDDEFQWWWSGTWVITVYSKNKSYFFHFLPHFTILMYLLTYFNTFNLNGHQHKYLTFIHIIDVWHQLSINWCLNWCKTSIIYKKS